MIVHYCWTLTCVLRGVTLEWTLQCGQSGELTWSPKSPRVWIWAEHFCSRNLDCHSLNRDSFSLWASMIPPSSVPCARLLSKAMRFSVFKGWRHSHSSLNPQIIETQIIRTGLNISFLCVGKFQYGKWLAQGYGAGLDMPRSLGFWPSVQDSLGFHGDNNQ